ncbi:hypothetical protein Tco_1454133 [Tanacetum coccineum]
MKAKKVDINLIDYASLNKLYDYFVPKKQLSVEQAFWLPTSITVPEKLTVQPEPVQNDLPHKLPSTSMVKQNFLNLKSHLDNFDKVIKVRTKVTRQNEGTTGFEHIRGAFEKDVIPFSKSARESFKKNKGLCKEVNEMKAIFEQMESEDAPEFYEFFEINELKAQLQAKNTTINNLKTQIEKFKEKSVTNCTEPVNNSKVIARGMFKLDLQPLSPKLKKNREARVDYLKLTKEHADTLRGIVEQARALKPLDNALDYACKYANRIQELLVYVSASCPSSRNDSERNWLLSH